MGIKEPNIRETLNGLSDATYGTPKQPITLFGSCYSKTPKRGFKMGLDRKPLAFIQQTWGDL